MLKHLPPVVPALLTLACATAACVEPAPTELGTDEAGIVGNRLFGGDGTEVWPGVVRIAIAGDAQVRTGVQLGSDLILTSSRWVTATTVPASITVANGAVGGSGVQVRTAAYVTVNPYLPFAIIQVTQAFPTPGLALDGRTAAQLASSGAAMTCFAYRTTADFRRAGQAARRTDGAREVIIGSPTGTLERLDDVDAGAPCVDPSTNALIGVALASPNVGETRVFALAHVAGFIDGMRRVAAMRRANNWATPFMVQTVAPDGTRMCLDVPSGNPYDHADVNQYRCHGGLNQRWLLDGAHPFGPAFVNMATGTCLDVPGLSTAAGTPMQMYACNGGSNQAWTARGNAAGLPGDTLSPGSSPTVWIGGSRRPTLCLSVRGGASNLTRRIEQATCDVNAAHQDWYLGYAL